MFTLSLAYKHLNTKGRRIKMDFSSFQRDSSHKH